uniref:GRAM domain containing 1B n=1 Tax=Leptobrachium leishanense TaxID=445787 RepID=A0A8C5MM56_9ANUR
MVVLTLLGECDRCAHGSLPWSNPGGRGGGYFLGWVWLDSVFISHVSCRVFVQESHLLEAVLRRVTVGQGPTWFGEEGGGSGCSVCERDTLDANPLRSHSVCQRSDPASLADRTRHAPDPARAFVESERSIERNRPVQWARRGAEGKMRGDAGGETLGDPCEKPMQEQEAMEIIESCSDWESDSGQEEVVFWYLDRFRSIPLEYETQIALESEDIPAVLSPTYKQRNEDFRKLFKQLPETERLIVDYSCALQRDILLQGRLYLSENWICFYSNIFRWETLLTVRLKDICSMTKEKTARLIPNAIQLCTDTEKHFFTSFGARDRTYMMMFRLWQNALLDKPLCPKELWHFVHQCYGNELGLTSDDEDYVPPDDDFTTVGYCEEIPVEDVEVIDNAAKTTNDIKHETNSNLQEPSLTSSNVTSTTSSEGPPQFDGAMLDEIDASLERELLFATLEEPKVELLPPVLSPSLDFNDNEDLPTELSDSSDTHDDGEVQSFYDDLNGRQYINEIFSFNVDKLFSLLFSESQFLRDFMEQRRFSEIVFHPWKKEENGNQTRVILYTIALTNPLAPKSATVTETQTLYKASQESECYVVDAEVLTHDIPYHDYFYTINRYTLTRVARNKSRLRISTELRYRKQPWGLVKAFIEKNFWSGLDEYFHHLENDLTKAETAYLSDLHRQSPKEKGGKMASTRRRKRPHVHMRIPHLQDVLSPVTTPTDEERQHRIRHVAGSTQTRHVPEEKHSHLQSISKLLLVISCVLILLVFLNVMLFYKLWMLEYSTQALNTWQGLPLTESTPLPQSQAEWTQLLESQQKHHDTEMQKWRQIIKSSVMLLDQMKDSLINLQNGIISRDFASEPEEKPY